ncbi:hypothetical protein PIB30_024371 [Stylosanthes scabra]|uniref:N-acetyltransferase domain-containing protein n=1 Tax=Stylosanthes scabra TaxID=79078 RepID=A0ABU6R9Z9_9FABA|nr:hypothetical protein [Stylosanthes scabra]
MESSPLGISVTSTAINSFQIQPFSIISLKKPTSFPSHHVSPSSYEFPPFSHSKSGLCRASEVVDLFPALCSQVRIREARMMDYWEVAETHCSCFFPEYSFPLDFLLRIDRLLLAMLAAMLTSLSRPRACKRICLVAVIGNGSGTSIHQTLSSFPSILNKEYVAGILTLDNFADYLPRKGPRRWRRTGIAYISNVAVRENFRGKGIAKKLIGKAESMARSWGCRAVALHCDLNNSMATKLYKGQGYKCVKVPKGAKWPQPRSSPDITFNFMMKLLNNSPASH